MKFWSKLARAATLLTCILYALGSYLSRYSTIRTVTFLDAVSSIWKNPGILSRNAPWPISSRSMAYESFNTGLKYHILRI